jgi:tRNA (adenine57-N1/adenine58-N1)-methyltransferase
MYETLLRPQEVSSVSLPSIDTAISKLRKAEVVGEERRLRQIELAMARNKRKREEAAGIGPTGENDEMLYSDGATAPPPLKKRKEAESNDDNSPTVMEEGELEDVHLQNEPKPSAISNGQQKPSRQSPNQVGGSSTQTHQVAHPFAEVRGHTSYLTFAIHLPYHHITNTQSGSTSSQEPQSSAEAVAPNASAGDTTITTEAPTDFSAYDDYFRSIPDAVSRPLRVP